MKKNQAEAARCFSLLNVSALRFRFLSTAKIASLGLVWEVEEMTGFNPLDILHFILSGG